MNGICITGAGKIMGTTQENLFLLFISPNYIDLPKSPGKGYAPE